MSSPLQGATGATLSLNSGALAIGSTKSQFAIGTAINFLVNGRFYQRATSASYALALEDNMGINPVLPDSFVNLAAGEAGALAVMVDTAGVMTVAQGPIVPVGSACPLPQAPAGKVIIGAIKVSNVTNPFVWGTTLFDASGVTTTYINLSGHPGTTV